MENIGRYRILSELGRGAGGVVYLAEDPKIGRRVAIKTISVVAASGAGGETLRKRLQREARSAGSLAHPNIVTVFELDDNGPFTFVVMEFVEGATLKHEMESGQRMETREILVFLRQVAEGLDFAHARSVVHRDIKPANIMLTTDRVVKIADFGVAKMLGDATMGLTQAGMAIGTPHYMSPEQVLGKPVTGRSDQFSLGVIAYELLAGSRPFEGDSITSIMYQIVNEEPPPPNLEKENMSAPVLPVLLRALAKEPTERYPTCFEFVTELEDALLYRRETVSKPVIAPSPPPRLAPLPQPEPPRLESPPPATPVIPRSAPVARPSVKWLTVGIAAVAILAALIFLVRGSSHHDNTPVPSANLVPQSSGPAKPKPPPAVESPKAVAPPKAETVKSEVAKPAPPQDDVETDVTQAKLGVHGTFTWSGSLAGGDSVEIVGNEPSQGSLAGKTLPRHALIKVIEVDPPDVSVNESPSADNGYTLRLVNSGREISSFSVSWRVAKKGEGATE